MAHGKNNNTKNRYMDNNNLNAEGWSLRTTKSNLWSMGAAQESRGYGKDDMLQHNLKQQRRKDKAFALQIGLDDYFHQEEVGDVKIPSAEIICAQNYLRKQRMRRERADFEKRLAA